MIRVLMIGLVFMVCGCADKIQAAKTAMAFVRLGTETCQGAFDTILKQKKEACLKKDPSSGEIFVKCFEPVKEKHELWTKMKPQLLQAYKLADASIVAAEQSKNKDKVDFMTPVKHSACLLAKCAVWLPPKWKTKVDSFIKLMAAFSCDKPTANVSQQEALMALKQYRDMLGELVRG